MDKTEKFFYLPQATNASFVLSPSDGPACTPEPLEPEPPPESEGPAGSYPCPCCGCLTFPVPKEEAIGRTTCSTRTRTPPATKTGE